MYETRLVPCNPHLWNIIEHTAEGTTPHTAVNSDIITGAMTITHIPGHVHLVVGV
jgi:hypothetical protein